MGCRLGAQVCTVGVLDCRLGRRLVTLRPRGSAIHFGRPSLAATLHAHAATLGEAAHLHAGQAVLGDESLEAARVLLDEEVAQEQRRLPDVSAEACGAVRGVFALPSERTAPRPSRNSSHARARVQGQSERGRASVRACEGALACLTGAASACALPSAGANSSGSSMIGARGGSTVPSPAASGRAEMPWHGALAAKTLRMTSMKALWMTSSTEPSLLSGRPAKQNCGAMCSVRTHGGSGLNCIQRARGKRKKLSSRPARAPTKSAVSASALALIAVSHFAILRSNRGPSRSGEVPRTCLGSGGR